MRNQKDRRVRLRDVGPRCKYYNYKAFTRQAGFVPNRGRAQPLAFLNRQP